MRSALYEPDFANSEIDPQRSATPPAQGAPLPSDEGFESEAPSIFPRATGAAEDLGERRSNRDSSRADGDSGRAEMKLKLKQKRALLKALWPKEKTSQLDVESLRVDLKEVEKIDPETFLSGYLVVKAKGLETRHLPNQGLVVFAAAGDLDVMQAQFRVGRDQALVLDMTRARSRTPKERSVNRWEGTLSLIQGEERETLGTLEGFVNPL